MSAKRRSTILQMLNKCFVFTGMRLGNYETLPEGDLMLDQRRRRWLNIKSALGLGYLLTSLRVVLVG